MQKSLTIATRKSPLALWQAYHVRERLQKIFPDVIILLLEMTTQGDERLDVSLTKIGGKGVFVKELERALYDGRADLAVHSLKDVPMELPDGLDLCCLMARDNPKDALVHREGKPRWGGFSDIPQGSRIATSSLRRIAQIRSLRPDIQLSPVRGNLGTRLRKLDSGDFDGLVLASAGLERLELGARIAFEVSPEDMLPACGQGILGIEIREDAEHTREMVMMLQDMPSEVTGRTERALNKHLNGGCLAPIAAYAIQKENQLWLRALVGSPDCGKLLRAEGTGDINNPQVLGTRVAEDLIAQGARELLSKTEL